jgi:hypothetical protein
MSLFRSIFGLVKPPKYGTAAVEYQFKLSKEYKDLKNELNRYIKQLDNKSSVEIHHLSKIREYFGKAWCIKDTINKTEPISLPGYKEKYYDITSCISIIEGDPSVRIYMSEKPVYFEEISESFGKATNAIDRWVLAQPPEPSESPSTPPFQLPPTIKYNEERYNKYSPKYRESESESESAATESAAAVFPSIYNQPRQSTEHLPTAIGGKRRNARTPKSKKRSRRSKKTRKRKTRFNSR